MVNKKEVERARSLMDRAIPSQGLNCGFEAHDGAILPPCPHLLFYTKDGLLFKPFGDVFAPAETYVIKI